MRLDRGRDKGLNLHATMLRLCGIDHKRLTYRYQGHDFRRTGVFGKVTEGIRA